MTYAKYIFFYFQTYANVCDYRIGQLIAYSGTLTALRSNVKQSSTSLLEAKLEAKFHNLEADIDNSENFLKSSWSSHSFEVVNILP